VHKIGLDRGSTSIFLLSRNFLPKTPVPVVGFERALQVARTAVAAVAVSQRWKTAWNRVISFRRINPEAGLIYSKTQLPVSVSVTNNNGTLPPPAVAAATATNHNSRSNVPPSTSRDLHHSS
jgi:hypothetical protein